MKKFLEKAMVALLTVTVLFWAACSADGGSASSDPKGSIKSVSISGLSSSISYNGTLTLTASPTFSDGATVSAKSYEWTLTGSAASLNATSTASVTLTADNTASTEATVTIKVKVTDSNGTSVESSTSTITIAANGVTVADEVTAVSISGTSSISATGSTTLTAKVEKTGSPEISYEWSITDGSGYATLSATNTESVSLTGNNTTTSSQTVKLQVTVGGVQSDEFTVTVEGIIDITNAAVKIVKSEGLCNAAYIVFEQLDGATSYKVYADDVALDAPLIRYYDTYTYNEYSESSSAWTKSTLSSVVRADALGLSAGSHTLKVCATNANGDTDYSTVTLTVKDHDRSGFAFTGSATPGAYNKDGTLKSGAVVIYLTHANKKTLTATIGSTTYTGIQDITQAIKTKNTGTTPFDIRIVGAVKAESNDLSCADHKSSYALGVKNASYVTIEGVGHDASLIGAGVAVFQSEYIEIANLGLIKWGGGKDGDGVALKADDYVWVHNNDVFYGDAGSDADQAKGDGSMDMKDDSKHVTVSYNHFWDSGKMSLCGMKSESGPNYITYHHNWFDHSDSRHPRIRTMTVHVYNNYFDGNSKYGVGVTTGASCFVEGNYFRNAHDPMMSSKQGTDATGSGTFSGEKGGVIKSYNNKFAENNTNGVKFQFITNKYDYTNNKELGEYKEWTETLGTENTDGTWTIYDSYIKTTSDNTIATNSLIAVEDATVKTNTEGTASYYQVSKSKTAFYIDVPANTTKIVINAKTGSSTSGATTNIAVKNESGTTLVTSENIGNSAYADYEFAISGLTADATLEIANTSGSYSLNFKEIKVIAASGWETTLSSGADLKNIDAYEVDNRSDTVPSTVVTKSGGTTYSNFDTTMGDSGLGLNNLPTEPDSAKTAVVTYSGRHTPDYAWTFTNATDDASYALNTELNAELVAYKTGMTKIQGEAASSGGGTSDDSGDSGSTGGDSGNTETTGELVAVAAGTYNMTVAGGYTKQDANAATQVVNNIAVSAKVETSDVVLKISNSAQQGTIKFVVGSTMTLVVTENSSNGVVIASSDGTATVDGTTVSSSELPTAKNTGTSISGKTMTLTAGTYELGGYSSSGSKVTTLTFASAE
ncbi:MAG: hypothetical protein IJ630_07080 [Treponema sp.]|nr:hypothetical protein [Treponema sp.]